MEASGESKKVHKPNNVLPAHVGGGPHNIGDPNDCTLRRVEADNILPKRVLKYLGKNQCKDLLTAFYDCYNRENAYTYAIRGACLTERRAEQACYVKWFHNPEFMQEQTEAYLRERAALRQTGMGPQQRRIEQFRQSKQQQQAQGQ